MKINKFILTAALLCVAMTIFSGSCYSLPELGKLTIRSPDESYELKLIDASSGDCTLILSGKKGEVARYSFQGYLVSAVWSPGNTYVAVNNQAGLSAWCVWIISTSDGKILTTHGSVSRLDYDHCNEDSITTISIEKLAESVIAKLYFRADKDVLNYRGSVCVAYEWKTDHDVLIFSDYDFQKLSSERGELIQIFTSLSVGETLDAKNSKFFAKFVKESDAEKVPEFVKKASAF